jgi:hypothetical protein
MGGVTKALQIKAIAVIFLNFFEPLHQNIRNTNAATLLLTGWRHLPSHIS